MKATTLVVFALVIGAVAMGISINSMMNALYAGNRRGALLSNMAVGLCLVFVIWLARSVVGMMS